MKKKDSHVTPAALLFDLDGTLVDTSRDISTNLNRAFEYYGYKPVPHEIVMSHVGYGAHFLVEKCIHEHDITRKVDEALVTELWEKFRDYYRRHIVEEATPYKGVIEFLEEISCPCAVISNKPEEFVHGVLKVLHLRRYFSFAWGRDSMPVHKPNPEIIRLATNKLGIPVNKDVWMIGDNVVDIRSAQGAGALSIAAGYGFSKRSTLENASPDHILDDFRELQYLLDNNDSR